MITGIKSPSFFRPSSRPSSPAPVGAVTLVAAQSESAIAADRVSRPLTKLALSNFRRPSPAPPRSPITVAPPVTQDGSYLQVLNLKLSEAVSRALIQPTGTAISNDMLGGKRPIPTGRGQVLGSLISSELAATRDNAHLHRAIIRSLHRPLSVLVNNLSAHLLPLISSPAFLTPPAPTQQAPSPNPTQLHAIGLANFAGEILDTFDEQGLGVDTSDVRGDGLKPIREGLASLVRRVINPLFGGIRMDLMPLLDSLENINTNLTPPTKPAAGTGRVSVIPHPSIVTLQSLLPLYAKSVARYSTTSMAQTTLATLIISIIWRSIVALAHRRLPLPTPPASPSLATSSLKQQARPSASVPVTPPTARFAIKLPPSRPPSPPHMQVPATVASDASTLYDLLKLLPHPVGERETVRLAREAVDEAFDGFKAFVVLLDALQADTVFSGHATVDAMHKNLDALTQDLPTLIALPVLIRSRNGSNDPRTLANMVHFTEAEYRTGCLSGFGRAEECAGLVGQRVYDVLAVDPHVDATLLEWLGREIADLDE